jgi:hypothetical protein
MTMRIHKITSKESWHCVAVSFSWMKREGGSSSSVPGFMYSVYHVTLIHPIEPSINVSRIKLRAILKRLKKRG